MTCYNHDLGAHLYIENAPRMAARAIDDTVVTIAQLDAERPERRTSAPLDPEDAVLLSLQFRNCPGHAVWENGCKAPPCDLLTGDTVIYDLRRDPRILIDHPFRTVAIHIPRAVFDALEEDAKSPPTGDISYRPGTGVPDERIMSLGSLLLPELAQPRACALFIGYVTVALVAHVASAYGHFKPNGRPAKSGLAPWQARRAQEMLSANLDGNLGLKDIARECGLSVSHFSRAFRGSVGMPPHRWLIKRRVDAAKARMREGREALSEIALACGFSDQSHFTRVFLRETGTSPGQWRRGLGAMTSFSSI